MRGKAIVCSLALIFGGCPKRKTGPRVVYIPTPPPAASPKETTPAQSSQTIVIQAPAPSEPELTAPPPAPEPSPEPQHRRPRRDERRRVEEASPQPEPAKVPAMEPSESTARESKLHEQVVRTQQQIQQRIIVLSREWLSPTERETLEGARGFLQQSLKALQESDLKRASNLAHKAQLLVEAIGQSQ